MFDSSPETLPCGTFRIRDSTLMRAVSVSAEPAFRPPYYSGLSQSVLAGRPGDTCSVLWWKTFDINKSAVAYDDDRKILQKLVTDIGSRLSVTLSHSMLSSRGIQATAADDGVGKQYDALYSLTSRLLY